MSRCTCQLDRALPRTVNGSPAMAFSSWSTTSASLQASKRTRSLSWLRVQFELRDYGVPQLPALVAETLRPIRCPFRASYQALFLG